MIPILYDNLLDAFGGSWTEKKGARSTYYYWNVETSTAVKTSTTSSYTAWDAISVTPGKVYHLQTRRGTWAKQKPLIFVKSDYTIINTYTSSVQAMDVFVTAPALAAYALITTSSISTANLNAVSFKEFTPGGAASNGLGRLGDCTRCIVTEERNGKYEVEFDYPITGKYYDVIQKDYIISVTHDEAGDRQPFKIYRKSAPIDGIVTFNAHHITYDLCNIIVQPFTATSISDAFDQFKTKAINQNNFTFWTDSTASGNFKAEVPASVRSLLGGQSGSILDVYGGEYEFDNMIVKNYAHRGNDNGVSILYGKNLTDITDTSDNSSTYNAVVPYWTDNEGTVVYGGIIAQSGASTYKVVALDLSADFETQPTVAQLEAKAASYLTANTPWNQSQNIKIDFVALWQTEEYKDVAPLERVRLCDTVHVKYAALGVDATAKVIKVVWNVLTDRYDSMELGEARSSFADTIISKADRDIEEALKPYARTSMMDEAISHATSLITGGLGGYIKFKYDANDNPTEMLIMDHDSEAAAVNILRINVNGIGFSNDGGTTYSSAWTLDGAFVADFITAGHLSCNRIQGGTLSLGGVDNGNGSLVVYDASGTEIGRWNKDGITLDKGKLTSADGNVYFDLTNNELACSEIVSPKLSASGYQAHLTGVTGQSNSSDYGYFEMKSGYSTSRLTFNPSLGVDNASEIRANNGLRLRSDANDYNYLNMVNGSTGYVEIGTNNGHNYIQLNQNGKINVGGALADSINFGLPMYINTNYLPNTSGATGLFTYLSIDQNTGRLYRGAPSSSSKRYKHDIKPIEAEELEPSRLYNVPVVQFIFNEGKGARPELRNKPVSGIIAEELDENYPIAVIHNEDGSAETWEPFYMIPPMLALIQEQKKQLDEHEERIKKLEAALEALKEARHE